MFVYQQKQIQSLNFNGQLEREWSFKVAVRQLKMVGGMQKNECLLIGLDDGQVLSIFLGNIFPVKLVKLTDPIVDIDISIQRKQLTIIDEQNNCSIFDIYTKQLLYQVKDNYKLFSLFKLFIIFYFWLSNFIV